MAGEIEFTTNYSDLSTDNGFQFEFRCDRCGNGYRTEFDTFELSTATNVLDGAGSMLGGHLRPGGRAWPRGPSRPPGRRPATRRSGRPRRRSVPKFVQCPRCSAWMCREQCWNEKKGLCKQCAPDLGVEMAAAQADKSVEEVWAHAKMAEEDKHLTEADWREGITASCPYVRRTAGDQRQVLRPVRRRPQGGQALHAVRGQAGAGRQVLLRLRLAGRLTAKTPRIGHSIRDFRTRRRPILR